MQKMLSYVRRAVDHYHMIDEGDRIAVGVSGGKETGGFVAATDAKDINWIIAVRQAPIAVSKTDVTRIFDPMTNQNANAWKIDYRKYHDLWITDNGMEGVLVSVNSAE